MTRPRLSRLFVAALTMLLAFGTSAGSVASVVPMVDRENAAPLACCDGPEVIDCAMSCAPLCTACLPANTSASHPAWPHRPFAAALFNVPLSYDAALDPPPPRSTVPSNVNRFQGILA